MTELDINYKSKYFKMKEEVHKYKAELIDAKTIYQTLQVKFNNLQFDYNCIKEEKDRIGNKERKKKKRGITQREEAISRINQERKED